MNWLVGALLLIDAGQTHYIAQHYDETGENGYYEKNFIIGPRASEGRINTYFGTMILANFYLYDKYDWYRNSGVYFIAGMQLNTVTNNAKIGIKFTF